MFLNLWQQPSKLIPPFDLFSLAGLASLLLAGCFFASSATPFPAASAPVLPAVAAADGATEVAACAADFFFFPPIMSLNLCLSASPLCGYVMPSHPQSPERWWLWTENQKIPLRCIPVLSVVMSGIVTFGPHSCRTGSTAVENLVLYCGKCAPNNHGRRLWRWFVQRVWRWSTNYHKQKDTRFFDTRYRVRCCVFAKKRNVGGLKSERTIVIGTWT